jgi:hypothetical protein
VAAFAVVPSAASATAFGKRTLSFGMSGNDVTALQGDLSATGYPIAVTGTFNRQTIREVRAFQRANGINVDGVAGPATFKRLAKALAKVDGNHITEQATTRGGAVGIVDDQTEAVSNTSTTATTTTTSQPTDGGTGLGAQATSNSMAPATLIDGIAVAAQGTPAQIVAVIAAANRIAFLPYHYGGGHGDYVVKNGVVQLDTGYDCSGSVSFALHGGNMLAEPLDSEEFASYGQPGAGNWLTLYTNGVSPTGIAHVYIQIAGLWFDTASQSASNGNDRWTTVRTSSPKGFEARHPNGW